MNVEVGQKVYILLGGNAARHRTGEELIEEHEVTRIGRKYFYVGKRRNELAFEIETGREKPNDYNSRCTLFLAKQDIYDAWEAERIRKEISDGFGHFRQHKLTLDQLKRIQAIIKE